MKSVSPYLDQLRLFAVVVTHNRLEQLKRTLARLLAEDFERIIVVDNASDDPTALWLAKACDPRIDVLRLKRNRGGAGGFHAGLKRASEGDPDWICVMDDDARPHDGAITAFRCSDLTGLDAAAAAVYHPDGRICEMNRPWQNPFTSVPHFLRALASGGRSGFKLRNEAYDDVLQRQIDEASFVGLFLSRSALARAGLPDPNLFIYGDDVIYTLGLSQSGGRIAFLPEVRFEHDCGSISSETGRLAPLWRVYYHRRNLIFAGQVAAGRLAPLLILFWRLKWWRSRRAYPDVETRIRYDQLVKLALSDARRGRKERPHEEILEISETPSG